MCVALRDPGDSIFGKTTSRRAATDQSLGLAHKPLCTNIGLISGPTLGLGSCCYVHRHRAQDRLRDMRTQSTAIHTSPLPPGALLFSEEELDEAEVAQSRLEAMYNVDAWSSQLKGASHPFLANLPTLIRAAHSHREAS